MITAICCLQTSAPTVTHLACDAIEVANDHLERSTVESTLPTDASAYIAVESQKMHLGMPAPGLRTACNEGYSCPLEQLQGNISESIEPCLLSAENRYQPGSSGRNSM